MADQGVYSLASIPVSSVRRLSTGFKYLDLTYGVSTFMDKHGRPVAQEGGLPRGGLSLWAGEPGVGKSRLCIAVAARMNLAGCRVLYFQGEASLHEFRQWTAAQVVNPQTFLISNLTNLDDQLNAVRRYKPHLVIVDSLNMIQGFQSPVFAKKIIESYKAAIVAVGGHALLVGHLNKAGTVKGSNDLQYLVDVTCHLRSAHGKFTTQQARTLAALHYDTAGMFYIAFTKNRYGPTHGAGYPMYCCFRHGPFGITFYTSNLENPLERDDG